MDVTLRFHGGAYEVGRSCIEVDFSTDKNNPKKVLLDAGVEISHQGPLYPTRIEHLKSVHAIVLSHGHLDHTGAIPLLEHEGLDCPIIGTAPTRDIAAVLLKDSLKIERLSHHHPAFAAVDIHRMIDRFNTLEYGQEGTIAATDINLKFHNAGHIPGSSLVEMNVHGKTILYTGDFNLTPTKLMSPASEPKNRPDLMITEATYGGREHPDRKQTEAEFLDEVGNTIGRGGTVLIPAFALGRAQEIMMVLAQRDWGVPMFLDGMAKTMTEVFLRHPSFIKDSEKLDHAYSRFRNVTGHHDRNDATRQQSIIVTTSGMLNGGPVIDYLKRLSHQDKNSILLTGYQGDHTNGRLLLEKGEVMLDGFASKVYANVRQFDFSAHSGESQIKELIGKANPKKLVIQHGDGENIEKLREWAEGSYDVHVPHLDDEVTI